MKTAAFVLALLVGGTQSLIAADCCCVIVCKHHSEVCSKCTHQGAVNAQPAAASKDCCKKSAAAAPESTHPHKRCAHVEPSSEMTVQAADAVAVPPPILLDLPPTPEAAPAGAVASDSPLHSVRGSPPLLHLLFSVLRI